MEHLISEYKDEILPDSCKTSDLNTFCEIEPQDPKVSFVVKAVSALTAAFKLLQLDRCKSTGGSSDPFPLREQCFHQVGFQSFENKR